MFSTTQPNEASAEYFTGRSYLQGLHRPTEHVPVGLVNVTIERLTLPHRDSELRCLRAHVGLTLIRTPRG